MTDLLAQDYIYLIGPTAVLSLALAAVAVSYVFLLIRLGKSEKDKLFLQSKIKDHAQDILKEAHEKRLKIMQDAVNQAGDIIKNSQLLTGEVKDKITEDMQEMRKKQFDILTQRQQQLTKFYEDFEKESRNLIFDQFKQMVKNMENFTSSGIKELREDIEKERQTVNKQIELRIQEENKRAQKAVEEYKIEQIKKIDKRVFDILQALTRDILGRSLTLKDHEELIQKALSQMKSDMNSDI